MKKEILCATRLNNPLTFTDPNGLWTWGKCKGTVEQCEDYADRLRDSVNKAKEALKNLDPASDEAKKLSKVLKRLGEEGKGGPSISFGDAGSDKGGNPYAGKTIGNSITINYEAVDKMEKSFGLNESQSEAVDAGLTGHEGAHLAKLRFRLLNLLQPGEGAALFMESVVDQGLHYTDDIFKLWNESWAKWTALRSKPNDRRALMMN